MHCYFSAWYSLQEYQDTTSNICEAETLNWLKWRRWKFYDNCLEEVTAVGSSTDAAFDSCHSSNVLRHRVFKIYELVQSKWCASRSPNSKVT
jgi:hypothetical protein